jgi:hypothetical protein
MNKSHRRTLRILGVLIAATVVPAFFQPIAGQIIITEVAPANAETLRDEDGDSTDWIELYYEGPEDVLDLEGWFLTDDPAVLAKWRFPAVSLEREDFLLIFCSGKDRRPSGDGASELHTSFRLNRNGDYLALVDPEGTTVWQYSPFFPFVQTDTSIGFAQASTETLVLSEGSTGAAFVPTSAELGLDWTLPGFADAAWLVGESPFGFDANFVPSFADLIQTDLAEIMHRQNATAYVRTLFELENPQEIQILRLRMKYGDGFVAYVNGVEIARANAPVFPAWDSRATTTRIASRATAFEDFAYRVADPAMLAQGTNLLAIHGLNNHPNNNDFFLSAELIVATRGPVETASVKFFETPTPGFPNGTGFDSVSPSPLASQSSGVFVGSVTAELLRPNRTGEIRFTRDGTVPSRESELYSMPLILEESTEIFARLFEDGRLPSPPLVLNHFVIDPEIGEFDSDLPLVLLDTFGEPPTGQFTRAQMVLIDRGESGRTRVTDEPELVVRSALEIRGSSSASFPKKQYKLELRDADGNDLDVPLLDMPAESDWVLFGAHAIDTSMLRNPLMYEISNQMGRYAPRTRFVEVFLNTRGGRLARQDQVGVYSILEKIKRGPARVAIEALESFHSEEPEVTGGYLLKMDRPDPAEPGFTAGGLPLVNVYPKSRDITRAQQTWIENYLNQLQSVLNGPNSHDPVNGYARFIDVDSFVDDHVITTFAKDIDSHLLSVYMFKPRGGKLQMGPAWDFDRSTGSDGTNPETKSDTADTRANGFWWGELTSDPAFVEKWGARWRELRRTTFSDENLETLVDGFAMEIEEAQVRDSEQWLQVTPEEWLGEIASLKDWILRRAGFLDGEFVLEPEFSVPGGLFASPFPVELSADHLLADIYYTLDGSDPRTPGGEISPTGVLYREAIVLTESTEVRARVRLSSGRWSDVAEQAYFTKLPTLTITEIMSNPTGGVGFEFMEIFNYGTEPQDMVGVRFRDGIAFQFTEAFPTLDPGEFVVLANDVEAFRSRYGDAVTPGGEFSNSLSNIGEVVTLLGPVGEPIASFKYLPTWFAETAGPGHSLVLVDPLTPANALGERASWRPSLEVHGSPGGSDSVGPMFRRGDVDGNGKLDTSDPINNLVFQFQGSFVPPCVDAADTDDSGRVDISDPLQSLTFQFLGLFEIPLPGPSICGEDPTPDVGGVDGDLGCEAAPVGCSG